jgi:nitrate/nitrite transporter NarK
VNALSGMNAKWLIFSGALMMMTALVLFAFADGPHKYWSLVFPGFLIGSAGAMLTNISAKYVSILFSNTHVISTYTASRCSELHLPPRQAQ